MRVLVTGAKGFVGKNLCSELKNIRDGKSIIKDLSIKDVYEYDIDSSLEELDTYCKKAVNDECLFLRSNGTKQIE